jgi:hypothetical protein
LTRPTFVWWSGIALIVWAAHLLVRDYIFAFTHGTTEAGEDLTLLGLTAREYASLWTAFGVLGIVGLGGIYVVASPRLGRLGKAGFALAFVGMSMGFVASVLGNWVVDPDRYFYSTPVYVGWLLSLLAYLVLAVGLTVAGIAIARANALPGGRFLVLVAGILLVPSVLLVGYLVGHSDGSRPTQWLYGSLTVPYDVCWFWLGVVLLRAAAAAVEGVGAPGGTRTHDL